ncbi:unnamed protein product [Prunus brigantina]
MHIRHEVLTRSAGVGKSAELLIHHELIYILLQPHYSDLEMEIGSSSGVNPSAGYSSSAFDPIIQMVRLASAPAVEKKMADMEGSASNFNDTNTNLSASLVQATLVSDVVLLSFHQAGDVIFNMPNDEEEEMKNEEGVESLGSTSKRSLQGLLELEDLLESSSVSIKVEAAKEVLATWASRPLTLHKAMWICRPFMRP